ncbi:MAG TPA: adenosylhomocysteinase [Nitrososphaeraceae archaeon]|nr:adenosylhomocysteinase [Nitrososphaeraceae archaeon]
MEYRVKDIKLADIGKKRIDWAESHMPVLNALRKKYESSKPLQGIKVGGCLHVTKETGVLVRTLKATGAEISWCGCNPLSTQDDVAASLARDEEIGIFASRGVSTEEYYTDIHSTMRFGPNITIDDGADLTVEIHNSLSSSSSSSNNYYLFGGTEETTTGVIRLRAMEKSGKLMYPIIAVNDAETKHDFDNVYGTGQSALDGIIRATNVLIAGKNVVVAGYGHVGKGIARRASGLGANVIVTEIDPISALKAKLDGYWVTYMGDAATKGDIFITTTGCKDVISFNNISNMKDGAILANAGHFNVEIAVAELEKNAIKKDPINDNTMKYELSQNKKIYLIGEGRLVNLAAAEGHPSEVMDMSFANQFLSVLRLSTNGKQLKPMVYNIDKSQDQEIALAKLESMNVKIDVLSPEQKEYLEGFSEGT